MWTSKQLENERKFAMMKKQHDKELRMLEKKYVRPATHSTFIKYTAQCALNCALSKYVLVYSTV